MNKILLYSALVLGLLIAGIFYVCATYYFRYGQTKNESFMKILGTSIILIIITYLIKIPVFYYFGKEVSILILYMIFLIITFILVIIFSNFVLNEPIQLYTYIIVILIVLLIILNDTLDLKYKLK